jgi:hypothetical protein
MKDINFIIYSPAYDEKVGGSIVLHRLCDLINKEGGQAYLYPMRPHFNIEKPIASTLDVLFHFLKNSRKSNFKRNVAFNTPIASIWDKKNSIIVYPEIISGNPLREKKVVRWLLHKPGFHTGLIRYDPEDLVFYFQDAFNEHSLDLKIGGKLQVVYPRTDIYRKTNFGERRGTCYLLRKGKGRKILHDLNNSLLIDDLSHEQIAKIFNQTERLISYDMYSLYSQYAAICGCISIVVPEEGVDKENWQPIEELRYGISYGFDDIEWAKKTQGKVAEYLSSQESNSSQSVRDFIAFCNHHFN